MPAVGQSCHKIMVGSGQDWQPVTYTDEQDNAPIGIANDLVKLVAKQLYIIVVIDIEVPWSRMLYKVRTGEFDMVSAIYRTTERERWYRYTKPFFMNQARIFVLKEKVFPFDSLNDLNGRTGIIPLGGSFGDEFDTFSIEQNLDLITVDHKASKEKMLMAGRADYYVLDYLDGIDYLQDKRVFVHCNLPLFYRLIV